MFNTVMKKTSLQTTPYHSLIGSRPLTVFRALVSITANTEQTGGVFNLFDVEVPPGYETPLHIHYAEDVAIQVIEGVLDIFWGTERRHAKAGSFFLQPRGFPHGFRVMGNSPARISYLTTPAGFDGFVIEHSQPVTDLESMMLEARFKIEVLGPLPE
jgi:quercetin dioxygenase-like cupin family protein